MCPMSRKFFPEPHVSIFNQLPDSFLSELLMRKQLKLMKLGFLAAQCAPYFSPAERWDVAKNTSWAAFCRQRRTKQSFNESRVGPKAQPSTGGVIHILLIAG